MKKIATPILMLAALFTLSSCHGENIKELEKGLSFASLTGDFGLEDFIENGGANNDKAVVRFLMEGAGCSTIQMEQKDGGYLFGRNFDWNHCNALILRTKPAAGYSSISTVNTDFIKAGAGIPFLPEEMLLRAAVYAPLDGMNEKGLCVSVNMIQDSATINQNTGKKGLTTTTAIRVLLDKAATVEEAVQILSEYDLHASFGYMVHFAISDAYGKSVVIEYINNEMVVIETPVLTNFYLAEGQKKGIGTSQSHQRFAVLEKWNGKKADGVSTVAKILESVSKHNYNEFESTEWSAVFDQKNMTATYFHRERYGKSWTYKITN